MKRIPAVLATAVLLHLVAWSQSTIQPDQLLFDKGVIAGGIYTNACLGFSLPIPADFQINTIPGVVEGKALHLPGGGLGLITIHRPTGKMFGDQIFLTARDASMTSMTAQDFVGNAARRQVQTDPEKRQLIHDALPVQSKGQQFFRADYEHLFTNGETQYESFMYTKFRGYFIGATLMAGSPEALDEVAAALAQISFREDVPNPKCVLGPDDGPRMGVIGGIVSSKPGAGANAGSPARVLVSHVVSEGLLIKKVPPVYPEAARKDRIQGTVVLDASIDANGNVEGVTLISGDALLAPSAIDAVKQWKYKPYTLNGQPRKIETQVRVDFTPPEN